AAQAVRISFLSVAIWWAVFTIPLLVFVRERRPAKPLGPLAAFRAGFGELATTLKDIRKYRPLVLFLAAYWLYIDGVNTIIKMAVDYGLSLGFESKNLITALLLTQFVAFPAALAFGRIGEWLGTRTGLLLGIGVYLATTLWGYFLDTIAEFYAMAVVIGLVQGGVQTLSRSLYGRLVPPEKSGEFFGFFNMMGKFAAVFGPAIFGRVGGPTGSPRLAIMSLRPLFGAGRPLLWPVRATPPASPALPARGGMAAQRNAAGVPCPLAAHRGKRRVAQRSRRRQPLGVDARPAFRRWWTAPLLPTNGSAPAPSKRLRGRGGAN